MNYKLFIPGPVAVSEKTLRAMAQPMMGHRSSDFIALSRSLQPQLETLFGTRDPVYLKGQLPPISFIGAQKQKTQG